MMTEEVTPVRTYVLVAVALVVLTVGDHRRLVLPLGPLARSVALGFATAKALLVALYFMNVRRSGRADEDRDHRRAVLARHPDRRRLDDYLTRTWLSMPGH